MTTWKWFLSPTKQNAINKVGLYSVNMIFLSYRDHKKNFAARYYLDMENSYLKAEIAVSSADVVYFSRRPKFHHMMQFFYITLKVPYYPSYMKVCSDFPYLPYFLRKINIIGEV